MKVNILDRNFAHHPDSCADGKKPRCIEWSRDNVKQGPVCFFTDLELQRVDSINIERKVAWLLEPPAINPSMYEWIKQNNRKFDFVLTFDKELLDRGENYLFYPFGVSWIPDNYVVPKKTKLCSMIASDKRFTEGHGFRQEIIREFKDKVDHFGRGFNFVENKEDALGEYYFSIAIENSQRDFYFSEKIIDCIDCLTVPIYWGASSIPNFLTAPCIFGMQTHDDEEFINPIITFNTIDELKDIVNSLTPELYNKYLNSLRKVKTAIGYSNLRVPEDWIHHKYPFLFNNLP